MILRKKHLLAKGRDIICRVGIWNYFQKFGRVFCHIAEGIKTGAIPIYLSHAQQASQRSSGLMNNV
jgi:hypothetical protein